MYKLKVGDKVRVLRTAQTHENGWENSWEGEMNKAVGKLGLVTDVDGLRHNINVSVDGIETFGYPDFVLELVLEKAKSTSAFSVAKDLAAKLAKQNPYKTVTIDLVQKELVRLGYTSVDLGNAAGSIFRGRCWLKVNRIKSNRNGSHAREIAVWKYVGIGSK